MGSMTALPREIDLLPQRPARSRAHLRAVSAPDPVADDLRRAAIQLHEAQATLLARLMTGAQSDPSRVFGGFR